MQLGCLYFVKDEFYEKFGQYGLMGNKEAVNGMSDIVPIFRELEQEIEDNQDNV